MKTIGIVGYRSEDGSVFGAGSNYLEFISRFGRPRIIFPDDGLIDLDLLVLPGGLDIAPQSFGAQPGFKTNNQDVFKQFFFEKRLSLYIDAGIPVFGICLGFQMLAVYFGSVLEQHLWRHPQSPARQTAGHAVEPLNDAARYAQAPFEVNSHHHQGVLLEDLSAELKPLALAKYSPDRQDYMIVEAFCHRNKPVMAVQWHPEEWFDTFSCNMMLDLLL